MNKQELKAFLLQLQPNQELTIPQDLRLVAPDSEEPDLVAGQKVKLDCIDIDSLCYNLPLLEITIDDLVDAIDFNRDGVNVFIGDSQTPVGLRFDHVSL